MRYNFLLLFIFISSLSFAYSNNPKVNEIADQLRCPTCQGLSVKESSSGLSNNMKAKIQELLDQGKSEREILTFFEQRYGEWILRSPKKEGFNWLLWAFPSIFFIITVPLLYSYLKKQQKKPSTKKPEEGDNEPNQNDQVNAEFESLKNTYLSE